MSALDTDFPGLFASFCSEYNKAILDGNRPALEAFYAPDAIVSIDVRRYTRDQIISYLCAQTHEFHLDVYSHLCLDGVHVLVSGIGIWENRHRSTTLVFQTNGVNPKPNLAIVNQIFI
jgi:hypothetical protein